MVRRGGDDERRHCSGVCPFPMVRFLSVATGVDRPPTPVAFSSSVLSVGR
ncbi:MAG: hypothetical protein ACI8TL_002061 [Natronomonas sp.]